MSDYNSSDAAEILAIANHLRNKVVDCDIDDLARRCIIAGNSVDDFRKVALNKLPEARPNQSPVSADLSGFPVKDWRKYSLTRALLSQAKDGVEREVSVELARRVGRTAQGFYVPDELFATRNLVAGTATLGGNLVQTTVMDSLFVEALRNRSACLEMGVTTMSATGPMTIPRQSAVGATTWLTETQASSLTNIGFSNLTLTPKAVGTLHQYSKMLLMEGLPSVDTLVKNDILNEIAIAIGAAILAGTGTEQPVGIAGTTGVNTVQIAANGLRMDNATCYPFLVSLESRVATSNVPMNGTCGYLMTNPTAAQCKVSQRFSSTDSPVWTTTKPGEGLVNGYKALATQQVRNNLTHGTATTQTSEIYFGQWQDVILAEFSPIDVITDIFTLAPNGVVRIAARKWVDVGLRNGVAFCRGLGVLGG